jgi:hypothetical protein
MVPDVEAVTDLLLKEKVCLYNHASSSLAPWFGFAVRFLFTLRFAFSPFGTPKTKELALVLGSPYLHVNRA